MSATSATLSHVYCCPNQAYAEFVRSRFDEAAQNPAFVIFTNRGTFHAKVVLGQIVSRARLSLDIFTGCLSSNVYDPAALRAASKLVKRPIRVLVGEVLPFTDPTALQHLRAEIESRAIEVRDVRGIRARAPELTLDHFAIGDGKHIRAEEDAGDRSATVMLNANAAAGGELASSYVAFFDKLWSRSDAWKMPDSF